MKIKCSFWSLVKYTNKLSEISKNCILMIWYVLMFFNETISNPFSILGIHLTHMFNLMYHACLQTYFKFTLWVILPQPCVFHRLHHANKKVFLHISIYLQKQKEVFSSKASSVGGVARGSQSTILAKSWRTDTATLADVLFWFKRTNTTSSYQTLGFLVFCGTQISNIFRTSK